MKKFKFNIKFIIIIIIIIIKFSLMFHKTFIKLYTGVKNNEKSQIIEPIFYFYTWF